MKPLLLAALFCLAALPNIQAASKYAGQYLAMAYSDGQPISGINIAVGDDGKLSGHGSYLDFREVYVTGKVKENGKAVIVESVYGNQTRYIARFSANGKKFTGTLPSGDTFKGKRLSASFPEAGIYRFVTEGTAQWLLIIENNTTLFGAFYTDEYVPYNVSGIVEGTDFSGSGDEANFKGSFGKDPYSGATIIEGVYSNGDTSSADFTGGKY